MARKTRNYMISSKEVFSHILKAGNFRKVARAKSKTGEAVYVNPEAEFIAVQRIVSTDNYIPLIEYYYMNMRGHRYSARNNSGYAIIQLDKCYTIHKLVMETFMGPTPKGLEINHKDEDKGNPVLSNLEFLSHKDNMKKFYANHPHHGLGKKFSGKYYASTGIYTAPDGTKTKMSLSDYVDLVRATRGEAAAKNVLRKRRDKAIYEVETAGKAEYDLKNALAKAIEIINAD